MRTGEHLDGFCESTGEIMNSPISAAEAAQSATLLRVIRRLTEARDVPHLSAALEHAIRDVTGAQAATFVLRRHDSATDAAESAMLADASMQSLPFAIELSGRLFERGEAV